MKTQRSGFYKGLTVLRREDQWLVYERAEHSVYRWWWEFLRLSPVIWYAKQAGVTPVDFTVAQVCEQAGDVLGDRFYDWWHNTGSLLFEEARRPLKLRRVDETAFDQHEFYPEGKSMLVEVPLTVTSRTLVKQFKALLAATHGHQRIDVLAQSNAVWRLYTKRYNLTALESQFWVLVYRLLHPNISAWRIGDRLQIAPGLQVRGIVAVSPKLHKTSPHARMQSTVGRFLYKAQRTVANAERASFPNIKAVTAVEMPFGPQYHGGYIEATQDSGDTPSAWKLWLKQEFEERLVERIKLKNRIRGMAAVNPTVVQRLPKFIAGESDQL